MNINTCSAFPNLILLIEGIWDGDVQCHELLTKGGDDMIVDFMRAEQLCVELKPKWLSFKDDPNGNFAEISSHKLWPSLKKVLELAEDLELE
jgi:hypothetical protein